MTVNYSEDDSICHECFVDPILKQRVETDGEVETCALCSATRRSITIRDLAELVFPIIEEHFAQGSYDPFRGEQRGDSLEEILTNEVFGQDLPFAECLVGALVDADPADPRDGDEPLIDSTAYYVSLRTDLTQHFSSWEAVELGLKHHRRFFNDDAKAFFDELFTNLDDLAAYATPDERRSGTDEWLPVVAAIPAGWEFFRARFCDSEEELNKFLGSPDQELGAPPGKRARAGRMNPDGVPVFYGALDEETALAELRPSIGRGAVVARFSVERALRVLDFRRLERAYSGTTPLSYFDPEFGRHVKRNAFLRKLHELISRPLSVAGEGDYLMTQYLAEYLAHVRPRPIDGLLFRSTQHHGGTNLVLFRRDQPIPGGQGGQPTGGEFPVRYVDGSARHFRTTAIEYASQRLDLYRRNDGKWFISGSDEYDDYDDDD